MIQMKTAELLARLKQLARAAGEALFERAGMALDVLADAQWIADTYDGDRGKAEEMIAAECFPDLSMGGWYAKVLILRQTFSDMELWRKHKFNLARLWIEYEKKQKGEKPSVERQGPIPLKEHEKIKEELKSAQYQMRKAKEEATNWEERCHDLERELAEAKGRIATLEMILDKLHPAAVA